MRFRSLPAATGLSSTSRRRFASPRGVMLPLSKNLLSTTLLGTALGAGAIVAGPLYAAPTLGSDANGPQVQILAPSYQDVLRGLFHIVVAVKATTYNPASIELFVDDRSASNGPMSLSSMSTSFDWHTERFADGPHKLTVRVTDVNGFRGWAEVNVFINNNRVVDTLPPTLDWKNLQNFETLSGTAQVQLQAADNFGVKWIYVSVNPNATADKKQAPLRSWLLNRPPYVVDFDTTRVPDGLYKLTAKAFDSTDQQGDAQPLTVGVVNNAINATTVGGLLDGLRAQDVASQKAATKVQSSTTAKDYPVWGESLPVPENNSGVDPLSGTKLGSQMVTPVKAAPSTPKFNAVAPKAPARSAKVVTPKLAPASPTRVAKATPALPESTQTVAQPGLSVRRPQDVAASGLAPLATDAETPKEWGQRLALAEVPTGSKRTLLEGQLSVQSSADARLLARSDLAPLPADIASLAPQADAVLTSSSVATLAGSDVASLEVTDSIGAALEAKAQPIRLARLALPTAQSRVLDEPSLSQPSISARFALGSVISTNEVTPALINAVNAETATEESAPVVQISAPAGLVDPQSKTRLSPTAVESRAQKVKVGIKPMPMQRAAAAWEKAKTVATKVVNRVSGKGTYPQIAALPRPDHATAARSAMGAAITVSPVASPLEVSEAVSIPLAYRVDRNTTLRAIAARYNLPVELVAACNGLEGNVRVTKGMKIQLPRPLQVTYAGMPVKSDVSSLMVGDTSTTAFRFMFQQAGGKLEWDAKNQRVIARKGNNQVVLTIGSKAAKVNDREVMMELAAFLFEGRTMVPVRFFEEGLNAQVQWDSQTGRLVVAMAG